MKLIPDWDPGTTKFSGSPDDANRGVEYLGQTFNVRDKIFGTAHMPKGKSPTGFGTHSPEPELSSV